MKIGQDCSTVEPGKLGGMLTEDLKEGRKEGRVWGGDRGMDPSSLSDV